MGAGAGGPATGAGSSGSGASFPLSTSPSRTRRAARGSEPPDEFIDISDALDIKVQAMLYHRSQFVDRPGRNPTREPGQFMRERAKQTGEQAGVSFAEAFQKIQFRT